MKATSKPTLSSKPKRSHLLAGLITALIGLSALVVYQYTQPARSERALREASLPELVARSKKDKNNPRVFYHLGKHLLGMGQLGPARAAFERAADLDNDDEEAVLAWADTEGKLGSTQQDFALLTVFIKRYPHSLNAHKALSTFYFSQDAMPRAYEEAIAAAKINPRDRETWHLAGISAMGSANYVQAQEAFQKAIELDPRDWKDLVSLGNSLDSQEKTREALIPLQKAASIAPNEALPTLAIGRAMLKLAVTPADVQAAETTLERAAAQFPSSSIPLVWLGRAYMRQKEWQKARVILEKAEKMTPDSYDIPYELKTVYSRLGNTAAAARESTKHDVLFEYAHASYDLLTRLHEVKGEEDKKLRLELARLYSAHGDYAKAAREYEQLVRRAPELDVAKMEMAVVVSHLPKREGTSDSPGNAIGSAISNIPTATLIQDGDAMLAQKRYSEAETAFGSALQKEPGLARAAEGLGLALDGDGKVNAAFTVLRHALKLDPNLLKAQYKVAQMYFDIGLPDEAAHRMEKLIAIDPKDPEYLHGLGICYLNTSQPQKAEEMLIRATTIAPDNASFWSDLANAELQNEKLSASEMHYRRALQLAPTSPELQVQLGTFLIDHGTKGAQQTEAGELFTKALGAAPSNEAALLGMGRLRLMSKQPKEAVTYLETLINHNPDSPQPYFQLAKAYEQLGDKKRAEYCRKVFRTVSEFETSRDNTIEQVRLHMKDPLLRLKLARLYSRGGQQAKALNQYQMCLYLDSKNAPAKKELETLTSQLKASGQLPSAERFNNMVSSSLNHK